MVLSSSFRNGNFSNLLVPETMSPLHVRSRVCMAPIHVVNKVCITPIHVWNKFADWEGSHADFTPHIEQKHSRYRYHLLP